MSKTIKKEGLNNEEMQRLINLYCLANPEQQKFIISFYTKKETLKEFIPKVRK
jgi:hypothetical protein